MLSGIINSLACCQQKYKLGQKKTTNSEVQKQFITLAKKTEEGVELSVVYTRPLQQSLNHLNQAYQKFFNQLKAQEKVNLSQGDK